MNEYFDQESIISYEKSEIIQEIYYSVLDLAFIFFSIFKFIYKNKHIKSLKNKLIRVFMFDIVGRIIYTRQYKSWNIYKELIILLINSMQFYLILSFLIKIAYQNKAHNLKKSNKKTDVTKACFIFFLINFQYENYLNKYVYKLILSLRCICILFFLFKIYINLREIILEISNNRIKQSKALTNNKINFFILGSPLSSTLLFALYYLLKVSIIFIKTPILILYLNIVLNIIKNSSKYFVFLICGAIIYVLNIAETEKEKEKEKENKYYSDETNKMNI